MFKLMNTAINQLGNLYPMLFSQDINGVLLSVCGYNQRVVPCDVVPGIVQGQFGIDLQLFDVVGGALSPHMEQSDKVLPILPVNDFYVPVS